MTPPPTSGYQRGMAELILPRKFQLRVYLISGFLAFYCCCHTHLLWVTPIRISGTMRVFLRLEWYGIVWYGIGLGIYFSSHRDVGMCLPDSPWYLHSGNVRVR